MEDFPSSGLGCYCLFWLTVKCFKLIVTKVETSENKRDCRVVKLLARLDSRSKRAMTRPPPVFLKNKNIWRSDLLLNSQWQRGCLQWQPPSPQPCHRFRLRRIRDPVSHHRAPTLRRSYSRISPHRGEEKYSQWDVRNYCLSLFTSRIKKSLTSSQDIGFFIIGITSLSASSKKTNDL